MKKKDYREEVLDDLIEILNNLEDDLKLDILRGIEGYINYEDSYKAIKKFTLNVVRKKIKKWHKINKPLWKLTKKDLNS